MLQVLLWVALWVVLVAAAGVVLFLLARSVWRKAAALLRELDRAAQQLSEVNEQLQELAERSAEPAVFESPSRLRQQRHLAARGASRLSGGAHDVT